MKNFFRTAVGKTVLFILILLSGAAAVASAFGIAFMVEEKVYTQTKQQVYEEVVRNLAINDGMRVLENTLGLTYSEPYDVLAGGNLEYELLDEDGKQVVSSENAKGTWTYTLYYQIATDGESYEYYYDSDYTGTEKKDTVSSGNGRMPAAHNSQGETVAADGEIDETATASEAEMPEEEEIPEEMRVNGGDFTVSHYTLHARLKQGLPAQDKYALFSDALELVYTLRYAIYVILLASLSIAILCFVGLMSVAGRKPDSEELYPGLLNKVPFDVMFLVGISVAVMPLGLAFEVSSDEILVVILLAVSCLFCYGVCVGICMDTAVRIKQRSLWKNTLTAICFRLCMRCLRFIFRGIRKVYKDMKGLMHGVPFARRVVLIYGFVSLIELCLLLAEAYLPVWVILRLVLLPAILYTGLTLQKLKEGGEALANGNLSYHTDTEKMHGDLKEHGENLNSIAAGMAIAVEDRLKSERMKTELITNVSHDIKTPLTSIINYASLIGNESCENEKITEYASVLVRQSERLKRLIEDLVEASKASSGNLDVNLSPCDASVFISQADGEYEEKLKNAGLTLISRHPEQEVRIMADGRRMWRIFDNLMNNICKYAQSGTRVYVALEVVDNKAVFSFKNTSREELNVSPEELLERFVRGDASRNTEGNGLGLSIAKSMAELQNGSLEISTDADLFKAVLTFPVIGP